MGDIDTKYYTRMKWDFFVILLLRLTAWSVGVCPSFVSVLFIMDFFCITYLHEGGGGTHLVSTTLPKPLITIYWTYSQCSPFNAILHLY